MKLVLLLAWRHLAFRPGKTLASVLGVALGIATVVSVLVIDHNTLLSQSAGRRESDLDVDLLVQPPLAGVESLEQVETELRSDPLLSGVTAFASGVRALAVDGRIVCGVELFALQREAAELHGAYVVAEGRDLDPMGPAPQLLLSTQVAEQTGLAVGDLVSLTEPARGRAPVVRCVEGELVPEEDPRPRGRAAAPAAPPRHHPFEVVGILAPTRLGYSSNRVLTTLPAGLAVLGERPNVRFWADYDHGRTNLAEVTQRLGERFVVSAPQRGLAGLAPEEAAFRSGVRFCGFLALFLGLYIIFNTMSMSLVERVRAIGLLRALGTTNGRLLAVFLGEGLGLALAGAGCALLLARWIVDLLVALRVTTLGFGRPLEILEIPWGPIAAVLGVGIVFCLAGVLYPFVRAARLSVIDALRRGVIELSRDPFTGVRRSVLLGLLAIVPVAWVIGAPSGEYVPAPLYEGLLMVFGLVGSAFVVLLLVPGLLAGLGRLLTRPFAGPAGALARATLAAARHRVFGTVSGLMLVFAAVFLIVSVLESLKSEVERFGEAALDGRLFVHVTPEGAERLAERALTEPALAELRPLSVETTSSFLVRAIDAGDLRHGSLADDASLREAFVGQPTIILSSRCADDFGKGPGDLLPMSTRASRAPVDFRVLAVSDEHGFAPDDRVFGVVSRETMRQYWCLDEEGIGGWFGGRLADLDDDQLQVLEASLADELGEHLVDVRRGEVVKGGYVADLDRDFGIFYAILALTVLLAAVGILNAMVIAVMERRREIGLLRAVGLTGAQVAGMLLLESGVLGVLGGLLGLLLGVPLAAVTVRALTEASHLDLVFALDGRALGAVLAGAVLVSLVAVTFPALRANRLKLSEVVRYE